MSAKRFRIAFSFAGEKRDFVAKVAAILARKFGEQAILYDKYHEAEFARYDLGIYLPKLYRDQSDLIVAVLCPEYDKKVWTGWEWMAIYAQLTKAEGSQIMLCRFGRAHVDGLFDAAAFVELDDKTPEQAATRILERLAINEGEAKDYYTADEELSGRVPTTKIPNNLPRLQPFFGRTEELKQIAEALDPKTRTWGALIDGPGGMGKTSLAVRAAYDCVPGQFDRIIFLSVKDRELDDDGERELGAFILPGFLEMLNELARELGQPDITKAAESERIRLILDVLERTRTLLILDNLESLTKRDRDQLFTFVKRLPQGCKAILTSRRRIGSGSELLILEKLDEAAALETLADLAKHSPLLAKTSKTERVGIFNQTDGNPLLLKWTAGQLGRGSCRNLEEALAFLCSCPPSNDPLEFIFGDLANEFTPDETGILVALTYFTRPAKLEHIAEVAGLDGKPCETALRSLANRSLVVPDQEETTFALVPMVADFLRRKRPEVVAETGRRLEQTAYALILENGFDMHERFGVLDAVWPTVAAALPLFIAGSGSQLQRVCVALQTFLYNTGRWDEMLSLFNQAENEALAAGDQHRALGLALWVGAVHERRNQVDDVLATANRIAGYWDLKKVGTRERAWVVGMRGRARKLKKDYGGAIADCRESLDLFRTLSTASRDVCIALHTLSEIERLSGDLTAAESDCREALRMANVIGDTDGVVTCTTSLAKLALAREDWQTAEELSRKALLLAEDIRDQMLIAFNRHSLAKALIRQGKSAEALQHARTALDIFTRLRLPEVEMACETLEECEA